MKHKTKLLTLAAFLVMALPLIFAGNAGAVYYNPDGSSLNTTTGLWVLPNYTDIHGCYIGGGTVNPAVASRFACRNTPISSLTTQSTCTAATAITSPLGWGSTTGAGRWSACTIGGLDATDPDNMGPMTSQCEDNGGTDVGFHRCSKNVINSDCTQIGVDLGIAVTAGGTATSPTCTTTALTAVQCAAAQGTALSGAPYMGSAAVSGATTTCTFYIGNDATACAAVGGGTITTTATDETRGACGGNTSFKLAASDPFGNNRTNCTKCHQPAYMDSLTVNPAGAVSNYIKASHKNASRRIKPNQPIANVYLDSNGVEQFGIFPYLPGLNSPMTDNTTAPNYPNTNYRRVDWVNGKIEDTTANASFVGLRNLPTGVFTEWYWEFGYYGEDPERGVYNAIAKSNGQPSAVQGGCFYCHATGYTGVTAKDTTKEPELSFPNISWDGTTTYAPGSRPGVVNLANTTVGGGASPTRKNRYTTGSYGYGSWDQFGVVCAQCHNSAGTVLPNSNHTSGGFGESNPTNGYMVNATCGQCHIRASSSSGAVTAPSTESLTLIKNVGTGHPNYHATDFLNSPHARFTGTYSQIASSANYDSHFMSNYNGCNGCHDPHGSVREPLLTLPASPAEEGIATPCSSCHTTVVSFKHPTDINGTPWLTADGTPRDACVVCHMPSGRHLFRINTDPNYTTTGGTANAPAPDGSFTQAVWVGIAAGSLQNNTQSACGQCHGGGVHAPASCAAGLCYDNAALEVYATGMHNAASSIPVAGYTNLMATGLTVSFQDTSTDPGYDTVSISVNWGDGTPFSVGTTNPPYLSGPTFTHTYLSAGTYTIIQTVKDEHNSYAYNFIKVQVSATGLVTKYDIGVNVKDNTGMDIKGATVYLKKQVTGGAIQIKTGYTDVGGNATFHVKAGETYRVVVYKSGLNGGPMDFDGSTAGKQATVKSSWFLLNANQAVTVQQGAWATNGPAGKEWKGTNGGAPTITP